MENVKLFFLIIAVIMKAFMRIIGSFFFLMIFLIGVSLYKFYVGSYSGYIYLTLGILCACAYEISCAIRSFK